MVANPDLTNPEREIFVMRKFLIGGLTVALAASSALAHDDVEVIVVGGGLYVPPTAEGYVFEGEFGEGLNPANFANEPGFDVEDGEFNPGDDLSFNVVTDLLYWDGVAFAAVPAGHSLEIANVINSVVVDGSSGFQNGFLLGVADGDGGLHTDPDYTLNGPGAPDSLAVGAYGLWLEMTSTQYATSNGFIIMLNYGLDEASFEAGVEAAAALVPEPSSAFLLALAAAGMWIRRR